MRLINFGVVGIAAAIASPAAAADLLYSHDGASETAYAFTTGLRSVYGGIETTVAPSGETFVGPLAQGQNVSMSIFGQGRYSSLRVSFDLYAVGSLDGSADPDRFQFRANGSDVLTASFSNFAGRPQSYGFPPGETGALGYEPLFGSDYGDSTYHLSFAIPNAGSNLVHLGFSGNTNQASDDEFFGLDNLVIEGEGLQAPLTLEQIGALETANAKKQIILNLLKGKVLPDPDLMEENFQRSKLFRIETKMPGGPAGVRGSLDPDFSNYAGLGLEGATLTEGSPAWVSDIVEFDDFVDEQLSFAYAMTGTGDGDWLELKFDDEVLWSSFGAVLEEGLVYNALFDASALTGRTGKLEFYLNSVGEKNAQFFLVYGVSGLATAVPEPATWAMMIAGFGMVGGTMRRRARLVASAVTC